MKFKKSRRLAYPSGVEANYRVRLLKLTSSIQQDIKSKLFPLLPSILAQADSTFRNDDFIDDIENVINEIKASAEYQALETIRDLIKVASNLGNFTLRQVAQSLASKIEIQLTPLIGNNRTLADMSLDIFNSPLNADLRLMMKSWIYTNTRLIKSIPENLLDDVGTIVQQAVRNGLSISTVKEQIKTKFNVSDNRARLIARDQIAKLNSDITKFEFTRLGYNEYVWVTSGDERVRTSHKVLNNKVCSWDDPNIYKDSPEDTKWKKRTSLIDPVKKVHATDKDIGQDFQCRCTPMAILPSL